jgi:signal transduction histidine kinase
VSIGRKLYLTYGLMAAFVVLMVLGTTRAMEHVGNDFEMIADQTVAAMGQLQDMRAAGLQIVTTSVEIALLEGKAESSLPAAQRGEVAQEILEEERQRSDAILAFQRAHTKYSQLVDLYFPGETGFRDQIGRWGTTLITGSGDLLAKMRSGAARERIIESKEALEDAEQGFLTDVKSSLGHHQREYRSREKALRQQIIQTRTIAWIGLSFVIAAIALLGFLATRRITAPLRELTSASRRLGRGELDVKVSTRSDDELGTLAEAFNRMADSIKTNIAQREAAEGRLHEAQKLKAIGQLTGGISHDFNNILAIIMGNAQLIREKGAGGHDKQIDAIDRAAARGSELTQRLLAYSRRQPLAPRAVELPRLISESEDLLRQSLGQSIDIRTTWDPDLWSVRADPGQIENALLNLALNAKHAMGEDGTFSISCSNAHIEDFHPGDDSDFVPGDYVLVKVSDTGAGMPADVVQQAFEPFFTTKEFGFGSGLGLSMVYGFAKQSGGQVKLESREGEGTTVTLYLPKTDQPTEEKALQRAESAPRGRGQKILVLENEEPVLDMVENMLLGLGYDVSGVSNVDAAQQILESGEVDLVLSDVVLGGDLSGPEFVVQARQRHPELKVVFMSGYVADHANTGLDPCDGEVLINKPFHRRDLAATVHQVLN